MSVVTEKLDARGLHCPLPILRTRKALNRMDSGAVLEVATTGAVKDIAVFCSQTGNRLVSSTQADHSYIFMIEKA